MRIEQGYVVELENGVELYLDMKIKGLYIATNYSNPYDSDKYIVQPCSDESGNTFIKVRRTLNQDEPIGAQIDMVLSDKNDTSIEIPRITSFTENKNIVKRLIDEMMQSEDELFHDDLYEVKQEKETGGNNMDKTSKDYLYHVRNDFNLMPGRPIPNLTLRENKGNIYETPTPIELEDMIIEVCGAYHGYNKSDDTIAVDNGKGIFYIQPVKETVYSNSIVGTGGTKPINIGDGIYVIALGDPIGETLVAVTIIRLEEKPRFEQIQSIYGRTCAIKRLYSRYKEEPGKIEYIFEQMSGMRYTRYEASDDCIFDNKADQMLKYALTKETYSPDSQRAYEALFRDPMNLKHKVEPKLQYLSKITPNYTHRKRVDGDALKKALDARFYKMDRVKQQIVDVLVSNDRAGIRGFNMLLVGSPGVGKTSVMETIAEAVNLPSEIIPLNGLTCPLELEGSDSGYDNADAGRLVRVFAGHGTSEMVIGFDEIDKMNRNSKEGDPMNVLYRMLTGDHEDKFLSCRISTENTIFIATANSVRNIPEAIMNRFNSVIYMDDYSFEDKLIIARKHIIPRLIEKYGLSEGQMVFENASLERIISDFCEDGGVRDLEHNMDMIIRRIISTCDIDETISINENRVTDILNEIVPDTPGIRFNKNRDEYSEEVAAEIRRCLEETKVSANTTDDRFAIDKIRQKLDYLMACRNEKKTFTNDFDPVRFSESLHKNLFGMDKVIKEATVFYHTLSGSGQIMNSNLALCGSFGIGKSEIVKNIADAIGYHFVKISLNGVTDAKELRGFSSTFSGSEPGRIIKGIKSVGSLNTVFQLDEIDKLKPELTPVLLDIMDRCFFDNFLGITVDLRNSIFIATANDWGNVPPVLRDRFIVVHVDGYTREEKSKIVTDFVIPKLEKSYAASGVTVSIDSDAKEYLLETYCPSFGVRDAEKAMQQIVGGKLVEQYGQENNNHIMIGMDDIRKHMGNEPIPGGNFPNIVDQCGITKALAVSGTNTGSAFAIETVLLDGDETLEITGLPKESAIDSVKVATTCLKKMNPTLLSGKQIHIHFGEGAVPKDGPSAGVAIFMSLYSAATGARVMDKNPYDIAFTGELSLTGGIFAVGGLMEKIQAANDSGCSKVFIPEQNYTRLDSEKIKSFGCDIIPVSDIRQVIEAV